MRIGGKTAQTGWICPKCGAGNSPHLMSCLCSVRCAGEPEQSIQPSAEPKKVVLGFPGTERALKPTIMGPSPLADDLMSEKAALYKGPVGLHHYNPQFIKEWPSTAEVRFTQADGDHDGTNGGPQAGHFWRTPKSVCLACPQCGEHHWISQPGESSPWDEPWTLTDDGKILPGFVCPCGCAGKVVLEGWINLSKLSRVYPTDAELEAADKA